MKAFKTAIILSLLLMVAGTLFAAEKYGDAVIEQGAMTVLREGRTLKFDRVNEPIQINENDLIRVRPNSQVVLNSRERATLTLGSNAVFHVKPWQSKGKTGFVRALFGRFRASISTLVGGSRFNVKTASATIGVKGTKYLFQVTNRAGTLLIVRENTVGFQGQRGPETDVNTGQISLIINFHPPTPPTAVPPGVENRWQNLDSPPPNSPGGGDFAGEDGLVQAGIVNQNQLNQGKGSGTPFGGGEGGGFTPPGTSFDPNEANDSLQRGRVQLQFN